MKTLNKKKIDDSYKRIKSIILKTPLVTNETVNRIANANVFFKLENLQYTGSFKLRGALSVLSDLVNEGGKVNKIVAASAGNYGLAIAEACKRNNIPCVIYVPENANKSKVERIKLTGSEVVKIGSDFDDAKLHGKKYAEDAGDIFLEDGDLDGMHVGAGTIGTEIINSGIDFDYIFVPIGNGSLISGIGKAFKDSKSKAQIIGLIPSASPCMYLALNGENYENQTADTIADGLSVRIPVMASVNRVKSIVDDVLMVDEKLLMKAMKSFIDYENLLVEPSSAITLAGLSEYREKFPENSKICFIITGGLVDPAMVDSVINSEGVI